MGAKDKADDRPGTADYMKQYLVEMDGDDSQFKDIDANVVPLSSGSSPPRQRPDDVLFEASWTTAEARHARRAVVPRTAQVHLAPDQGAPVHGAPVSGAPDAACSGSSAVRRPREGRAVRCLRQALGRCGSRQFERARAR